jgi:hypothetical protein
MQRLADKPQQKLRRFTADLANTNNFSTQAAGWAFADPLA